MAKTQEGVQFFFEVPDGLTWYIDGGVPLTTEEAQVIATAKLKEGMSDVAAALTQIADAIRERGD